MQFVQYNTICLQPHASAFMWPGARIIRRFAPGRSGPNSHAPLHHRAQSPPLGYQHRPNTTAPDVQIPRPVTEWNAVLRGRPVFVRKIFRTCCWCSS